MLKMQKSNILIFGMNGLGCEIAKNVILAGVKSVTIVDQKITSYDDLSSQVNFEKLHIFYSTNVKINSIFIFIKFFLNVNDVGKNRAECVHAKLAELNTYVAVNIYSGEISSDFMRNFQVIF